MARRSPGTGSIITRRDSRGRETYYGKWTPPGGRQVKRALGPKRAGGSADGLTRREAEAMLRTLMAEVQARPVVTRSMDIRAAGDEYVANMIQRGKKPSSVRSVRMVLRAWLVPQFAGRSLEAITPEDVDDLVRTMQTAGLSVKTIRNYVGVLAAVFTFARNPRRGWVTSNPVDAVDLPDVPVYDEVRFLPVEDVWALADAALPGAYQEIDRAMYLTAAITGLRQGECIALRWNDLKLAAMKVSVERTYDRYEDVFTTPKGGKGRVVPLADGLAGELERYGKARHGEDFDPADIADQLVFADPLTGGPQNDERLRERYKKALKAAHLPERRFHDLRHTFGTTMAGHGVAMRTVQAWMGHADISTTERYAAYAPNADEASWINAAFDRGTSRGTSVSAPGVPERTSENVRAA